MWSARVKDAGLAAAVLLVQSAPFLFSAPIPGDDLWTLLGYLPVLGSALPVLFRRAAPLTALLTAELCVGAYGVIGEGPDQPVWYAVLICLYTVGLRAPRSHQIAALMISAIGMIAVIGSLSTGIRELLTWSGAFALGLLTRSRQTLAARGAAQAAELAASQERNRIARELHDILGHAVSLMVVQAEAGGAVARRDAVRAEATFDVIAETGRTAMRQLRTTVGALRNAPREPQPGLAELPTLVRESERAGHTVRLVEHGTPRTLPPDVQLAAYRIVQEALTNVVKHADAKLVEVALRWGEDRLRLTITDDGRGPRAADRRSADLQAADQRAADRTADPGGGQGLVGMRERVASVGGTIHFGVPEGQRGFQVEAVF